VSGYAGAKFDAQFFSLGSHSSLSGKGDKMNTKTVIFLGAILLVCSFQFAEAQEPKKIPQIGYLSGGSSSALSPRTDAFRQGLREVGYTEGQNVVIESRYADGNLDRIPELAAELLGLKVNVIVSGTEQGIRAAQKATKTIPIVIAATGDPVESGFVTSLTRPGGNITGTTSSVSSESTRKQVELFKEAVPQLSQLAVLWNTSNVSQRQRIKDVEAAGKTLELKVQLLGLERPADADNIFSAMTKERPDGLLIFRSPIIRILGTRVTEFTDKNRLPTMYSDSQFVESGGGLMSYAPNIPDLDRLTAVYVDKILKGAKPGDLPVEGPKKFELGINLKTAQQIGLTIPQTVLSQANRVIK
jgi:putative ABC transport system substrate-binding protein